MRRVLVLLSLFVCALPLFAVEPKPAAGATNQAPRSTSNATAPVEIIRFDCYSIGAGEYGSDLYIRNMGNTVLTKGTKLHWVARFGSNTYAGDFTLDAEMAAGQGKTLSKALTTPLPVGTRCEVTVISKPKVLSAPHPAAATLLSPLPCKLLGNVTASHPFPEYVYIQNNTTATIPAGKVLQWHFPSIGRQGEFTLKNDLPPNKWAFEREDPQLPPDSKCIGKIK